MKKVLIMAIIAIFTTSLALEAKTKIVNVGRDTYITVTNGEFTHHEFPEPGMDHFTYGTVKTKKTEGAGNGGGNLYVTYCLSGGYDNCRVQYHKVSGMNTKDGREVYNEVFIKDKLSNIEQAVVTRIEKGMKTGTIKKKYNLNNFVIIITSEWKVNEDKSYKNTINVDAFEIIEDTEQ